MKKMHFSPALLLAAILAGCQTAAPLVSAMHAGDRAFSVAIRPSRQLEDIVTRHMAKDINYYVATLYLWDSATGFSPQPNPVTVKAINDTAVTFGNLGPYKYQVRVVGYDAGNTPITVPASGIATVDLTINDVNTTPVVAIQPVLLGVPFSGKLTLPAAPQWATQMRAVVEAGGKTLADLTYNPGQNATAANLAVDTQYSITVTASGQNGYTDTETEPYAINSQNGNSWLDDTNLFAPTFWFNWQGYTVGSTPESVAVDGSGNVWVACAVDSVVEELSSIGTLIGTYSINEPDEIAIDRTSGNVWVRSGDFTLTELSSTGSVIATFSAGGNVRGMTVDSSGNVWVTNNNEANSTSNNDTVTELSSTGSVIRTYALPDNSEPSDLSANGAGGVWVVLGGQVPGVTDISSTGSSISWISAPITYFFGQQYHDIPKRVVADPTHGAVWVAFAGAFASDVYYQPGEILKVTSTGNAQYPFAGNTAAGDIAVDSSGDCWVSDQSDHKVLMLTTGLSVATHYDGVEWPAGVAVDAQGNAWVASQEPSPRIIKFAP